VFSRISPLSQAVFFCEAYRAIFLTDFLWILLAGGVTAALIAVILFFQASPASCFSLLKIGICT
jgi:hypothetical protein